MNTEIAVKEIPPEIGFEVKAWAASRDFFLTSKGEKVDKEKEKKRRIPV